MLNAFVPRTPTLVTIWDGAAHDTCEFYPGQARMSLDSFGLVL